MSDQLSDDQLNRALAEACGWVKIDPPKDGAWGFALSSKEWCYTHQLPRYTEDLNACADAEKHIIEAGGCYTHYVSELQRLTEHNEWRATARQRVIAMLTALDKLPK